MEGYKNNSNNNNNSNNKHGSFHRTPLWEAISYL